MEDLKAIEEMEKCKDIVYFYENYLLVNGEKPTPLTHHEKVNLRKLAEATGTVRPYRH